MEYYVLAFMDVLGFSEMVKSDAARAGAEYLPIFVETIEDLRGAFSPDDGFEVKMFSDSLVVSAQLSPENVSRVVGVCAFLQQRFLAKGILLRGGLSYGKHYSDDFVMFSDALVAAYEIESKRARYPRIVVDENLFDFFINHPELHVEIRGSVCDALRRDRDGALFVHYLTKDAFLELTSNIAKMLLVKISVESVLEKMRWLHDYHTYCANEYKLPGAVINNLKATFSVVG